MIASHWRGENTWLPQASSYGHTSEGAAVGIRSVLAGGTWVPLGVEVPVTTAGSGADVVGPALAPAERGAEVNVRAATIPTRATTMTTRRAIDAAVDGVGDGLVRPRS
jgi:hypothetical protein